MVENLGWFASWHQGLENPKQNWSKNPFFVGGERGIYGTKHRAQASLRLSSRHACLESLRPAVPCCDFSAENQYGGRSQRVSVIRERVTFTSRQAKVKSKENSRNTRNWWLGNGPVWRVTIRTMLEIAVATSARLHKESHTRGTNKSQESAGKTRGGGPKWWAGLLHKHVWWKYRL